MNISVGRIVSANYVYILLQINGGTEGSIKSYSETNIKVMQQFKTTRLPLRVYATRKFRIWIKHSK